MLTPIEQIALACLDLEADGDYDNLSEVTGFATPQLQSIHEGLRQKATETA